MFCCIRPLSAWNLRNNEMAGYYPDIVIGCVGAVPTSAASLCPSLKDKIFRQT